MKHLLAMMALCVAFAAGAQTGLVEFPYNPDADNDDMIGTADLLALLSLYGAEFSEENVYMSEDSTSALVYTGEHNFYRCYKSCEDLPGNWRLPDYYDMLGQELASFDFCDGCYAWIDLSIEGKPDPTGGYHRYMAVSFGNDNDGAISNGGSPSDDKHCLCYTHERPKVEYSYCRTDDGSEFTSCCNEKVADGWYPLAATTGVSGNQYAGGNLFGQAFWRWAD